MFCNVIKAVLNTKRDGFLRYILIVSLELETSRELDIIIQVTKYSIGDIINT